MQDSAAIICCQQRSGWRRPSASGGALGRVDLFLHRGVRLNYHRFQIKVFSKLYLFQIGLAKNSSLIEYIYGKYSNESIV